MTAPAETMAFIFYIKIFYIYFIVEKFTINVYIEFFYKEQLD